MNTSANCAGNAGGGNVQCHQPTTARPKPRVLHVISSIDPRAGGTTAAVQGLTIAQARAGVSVTILATFREGFDPTAADAMRDAGVAVILIGPARSPLSWHSAIRADMHKAISACDIVHIHALWEEVQHQAAVIARRLKVPYVITPHGMLSPWSLSQSPWKKRLYWAWRLRRNLVGAAALHYTADIERGLVKALKISPPTTIAPNGIDLSEFQSPPARGTFRARHKIPVDAPVVLFLGRLHPNKGCDLLIKGFARAAAQKNENCLPEPLLVFAGPDANNFRAELESIAIEHGVGKSVFFVGPLYGEDKLAAFIDADLFALISHHENFGIAVIEALAAGCPVLLSDQVSTHDLIKKERVGWVVKTSAEATALALRDWLKSFSRDEEMRQRARATAARYDWQAIADSWVDEYQRIAFQSRRLDCHSTRKP